MSKNYYGDAKTILADVWDQANHRLRTIAGGAGGAQFYGRLEDILADCWDQAGHFLRTSGGGGGGGSKITQGAYGSEPVSPATGDLYLPNDGSPETEDWDGALWQPWGPIWKLTKPPVIGVRSQTVFGWFNQGTATASVAQGTITLKNAAVARNIIGLTLTTPATPYTKTAMLLPVFSMNVSTAYGYGMFWTDGTGLHTLQYYFTNSPNIGALYVGRWTNVTTFGSWDLQQSITYGGPAPIQFMRLFDDGVTRHFQVSWDGINYTDIFSTPRTTFITPTQVGFFFDIEGATTANNGVCLLSWV